MTGPRYRYRNTYPGGAKALTVRGERVEHGDWSEWGERLPAGTRALVRGHLVEEEQPTEKPKRPTRKPAAPDTENGTPPPTEG